MNKIAFMSKPLFIYLLNSTIGMAFFNMVQHLATFQFVIYLDINVRGSFHTASVDM